MDTRIAARFPVSEVELASEPRHAMPAREAIADFVGAEVEAWAPLGDSLVLAPQRMDAVLGASFLAFSTHYPLSLSPDAIWTTILGGVAQHVQANAEALRGRLVAHEGTQTLEVRRDDFVPGSPENPWDEMVGVFSEQLRAKAGALSELCLGDFSTTGTPQRAAMGIALMAAASPYFSYDFMTLCGIPSITLEGETADWIALRDRTERLAELDLGPWVAALRPLTTAFVDAAQGRVDEQFWQSWFKWDDMSGGPYVDGWIGVLYPYLSVGRELRLNPNLSRYAARRTSTIKAEYMPAGPARASFRWRLPDGDRQMQLIGGAIGIEQDPQHYTLRPVVGWAVAEAPSE